MGVGWGRRWVSVNMVDVLSHPPLAQLAQCCVQWLNLSGLSHKEELLDVSVDP